VYHLRAGHHPDSVPALSRCSTPERLFWSAHRVGPSVSRCASAIQSVRPSESMSETQPKLQPALLSLSAMISQCFMPVDCASFILHAATIFSGHVAVSGLRWTADGFPKACNHKYLSDHRLDRFDHRLDRFDYRLSKRCLALGCNNTLADRSTFNSAAATVPNSHPHSRACIKSNTHSYADSESDSITKPSTCRNASPAYTPPQIASHAVRPIRVYDDTGNVIQTHEHKGDFKVW